MAARIGGLAAPVQAIWRPAPWGRGAGSPARAVTSHRTNPADRYDGVMTAERHLEWEGCFDARDLGGLRTAGGRDRTGLVVRLLLALANVVPEEIAADYELSAERLGPLYAQLGWGDVNGKIEEILAREGTSARATVLAPLASFDVDGCLRAGGLGDAELAAVRARLLGPEVPGSASTPSTR